MQIADLRHNKKPGFCGKPGFRFIRGFSTVQDLLLLAG
jgi:hypothetical protein